MFTLKLNFWKAFNFISLNLFFDIKQIEDGTHIALKSPEELPKDIPLEKIVNQYNTMYLYWMIYKTINCYTLEIEHFNKKYIFKIVF